MRTKSRMQFGDQPLPHDLASINGHLGTQRVYWSSSETSGDHAFLDHRTALRSTNFVRTPKSASIANFNHSST
ncbi:hypothetical protein C8J98_1086 [Luteibacter sp. OK325]|nr:hypothetical protein C8J98_1086 [Luteibacter sp. OK325]